MIQTRGFFLIIKAPLLPPLQDVLGFFLRTRVGQAGDGRDFETDQGSLGTAVQRRRFGALEYEDAERVCVTSGGIW